MLSVALSLLMAPKADVVVLESTSLGTIKNKITITRTMRPDGGLTWLERTDMDKDTYWLDSREVQPDGSHVLHSIKWFAPKEDHEWQTFPSDDSIQAVTIKYRGKDVGTSEYFELTPLEAGDPSLLWWVSKTPKIGDIANGCLYIPLNGMKRLNVTYKGDEKIKVKGKEVTTHKIVRAMDVRNETWWLNDKGLPVQRAIWSKDENEPHRVDVLK